MIVIHYPTAYKALDGFIDAFNERVAHKKERLRTGAVMTAKELIRIYGISLLKANGCQEIKEEELPSLQTNNQQLAKLVKCSSRTIQRHIHKLHSAGIITHKVFHGSNSNFELLINPKILLVKQKLTVDNTQKQFRQEIERAEQNHLKSTFLKFSKTNCPHTYSSNTSNKINNLVIGVDNSFLPASEARENEFKNSLQPLSKKKTGNTGEIAYSVVEKEFFKKENSETGEIASRAEQSGHRDVAPDPARDNSLSFYASLLWMTARNLLYKETYLTERQVEIGEKLIRKLYEPVATHNLSNVHSHYIERISLVAKYIKKDPEHRFVQLPYRYFDTNNPKGFVGTKKWHQADRERKREVERELILSRVIRRYQSNGQKEPAKRKPVLQLFRECENTIGKFNDPSLTQRFHAAVLQHETFRQISYAH